MPSRAGTPRSAHEPHLASAEHLLGLIRVLDSKLDAISEAVGAARVESAQPSSEGRFSGSVNQQLERLRRGGSHPELPSLYSFSAVPSGLGDMCRRVSSIMSAEPVSNLKVRPEYCQGPGRSSRRGEGSGRWSDKSSRGSSVAARRYTSNSLMQVTETLSEEKATFCRAWHPDSASRTALDIVSLFFILYDAFLVPYQVAWQVSSEGFYLQVATWITRVFWTLDLLLNLVTGFRDKDAKLEIGLRRSVGRYVSTWFVPDLALVTCDWATTGRVSWLRGLRFMRLVRSGRQVVRAHTLILKSKLRIQHKAFHLCTDISLLLVFIIWVNHVICCGWFWIGSLPDSDTGDSWVTWLEAVEGRSGSYYDYLSSLHWAFTQMTPGSMEIVPRNSRERIYNVATLLLALMIGSSIVATLTSMLMQYKLRMEESSRKVMVLHQFLIQQGVDPELALVIKMQAKSRCSEKARLKWQDVEYLSLLSNTTRDSLWHAWCTRHLSQHPFLNSLEVVHGAASRALCKSALATRELAMGDVVFEEGAMGEHMYFVLYGQLRYHPGDLAPELGMGESEPSLTLKPGAWCAEPTLWTIWMHLGALEALSTCDVLALSGPSLFATVTRFPKAHALVVDYAQTYHRHVHGSSLLTGTTALKSDLSYAVDGFEVISGLSKDARLQLAQPVFERLESSFWEGFLHKQKLELLKQEVEEGKCDVAMVAREAVRNTCVVCLEIHATAEDPRFLVKVGELEETGRNLALCLLPGVKRRWNESYDTAMERLLGQELSDLSDCVDRQLTEGSRRSVSTSISISFGIKTRYLRIIFSGQLLPEAKLLAMAAPGQPAAEADARPGWRRWREGRPRRMEALEVAAILARQSSVVVVDTENKFGLGVRKLYLWLDAHEFEMLGRESARPALEQWVARMRESTLPCLRMLSETTLPPETPMRSLLTQERTNESSEGSFIQPDAPPTTPPLEVDLAPRRKCTL